jgi:hypothetical protein
MIGCAAAQLALRRAIRSEVRLKLTPKVCRKQQEQQLRGEWRRRGGRRHPLAAHAVEVLRERRSVASQAVGLEQGGKQKVHLVPKLVRTQQPGRVPLCSNSEDVLQGEAKGRHKRLDRKDCDDGGRVIVRGKRASCESGRAGRHRFAETERGRRPASLARRSHHTRLGGARPDEAGATRTLGVKACLEALVV